MEKHQLTRSHFFVPFDEIFFSFFQRKSSIWQRNTPAFIQQWYANYCEFSNHCVEKGVGSWALTGESLSVELSPRWKPSAWRSFLVSCFLLSAKFPTICSKQIPLKCNTSACLNEQLLSDKFLLKEAINLFCWWICTKMKTADCLFNLPEGMWHAFVGNVWTNKILK